MLLRIIARIVLRFGGDLTRVLTPRLWLRGRGAARSFEDSRRRFKSGG